MVRFVIVADLRTGSTLLASSLNRHPQIRCYGELFHSQDLPDNRVEGLDGRRSSAARILQSALTAAEPGARGFKAMVFLPLPEAVAWGDAWDRLRAVPGLRVLWLHRRDRLAQYASLEVARHTGVFHPPDDDGLYSPENRPRITVEPAAFRAWVEERDALMRRRRQELDGLPALDLAYETLVSDWVRSTNRVQEFLEVDVQPLGKLKQKQERRPLTEVIANYAELAAECASG